MRLLEFDKREELCLSKKFTGRTPRYAILSHTWGSDEEEEVTFHDLLEKHTGDRPCKSKSGYGKLIFCGEQAQNDGLRYFWVDTCCINRDNSQELTESITSMFDWYSQSNKCYVYMSDVSFGGKEDVKQSERPWESEFRNSRWFRRGWTLQELLAPQSVEFFSREGYLLGDRTTLKQIIHEITKIPIAAIEGSKPLSEFSDGEKMRWTEGRETTRKEDRAYCLLGIFDISMPANYGEGDRAFKRLKRELGMSPKGQCHILNPRCSPSLLGNCVLAVQLLVDSTGFNAEETIPSPLQ